jgi:hypothetical protein
MQKIGAYPQKFRVFTWKMIFILSYENELNGFVYHNFVQKLFLFKI